MVFRNPFKGSTANQPKPQESQTRRFRLVRYFTLTSLSMLVPVALALTYFLVQQGNLFRQHSQENREYLKKVQEGLSKQQDDAAQRDLLATHEAANVNLAHLLANTLWERDFAPFVASAQKIPVEACRAMADVKDEKNGEMKPSREKQACLSELGKKFMRIPGFADLNAKVYAAMRKSTVVKIKVFDLRGITLYSSEHSQIGQDRASNPGWMQAASEGKPTSGLTFRDKFSAFEGVVEKRDLISVYLPLLQPGSNRIVGVFETYSDVTPLLEQIKKTSADIKKSSAANLVMAEQANAAMQAKMEKSGNQTLAIVLVLVLALFGALLMLVRRADGIITKQENEREKAGEALRASEAQLRQITENMAEGVITTTTEDLVLEANTAALQLFGYEKSELIGHDVSELVPERHRRQYKDTTAALAAQPEAFNIHGHEVRSLRKDGSEFTASMSFSDVQVGGRRLFTALILDISDRKRAQDEILRLNASLEERVQQRTEALRASEAQLRQITESMAEGVITTTTEDLVLEANTAALQLFGYEKSELIGHDVSELVPERHRRQYKDTTAALAAQPESFKIPGRELRSLRKDGSEFSTSISFADVQVGGRRLFTGVILDITERKRAEQVLHESEERFRALTELSSDWYWEQDEQFRFVALSAGLEQRTGSTIAGHLGKTRWELPTVGVAEEQWAAHRAALEAHLPFHDFEYARLNDAGELVWIRTSGAPAFDEHGKFRGYRGVSKNITKYKRARRALHESAEKLRLAMDAADLYEWEWDVPRDTLTWGRDPIRLLGRPDEQTRKYPDFRDLLHPEDRERYLALGRHAMRTGEPYSSEFRVVTRDGAIVWVAARGKVVFDSAGAVTRMTGVSQDISERKRAEQALALKTAVLRDTFEHMDQGISIIDADLKIIGWNRRCLELLDFSESLFNERTTLVDLFRFNAQRGEYGPGDVEELLAKRVALARRFEPHVFERERPDGAVLEVRGVPLPGGGFVTTYTDVTVRRRAEQTLRESEERFRKLIDLSPDATYVHCDGRIVLANQAAARLFRAERPEQLLGLEAQELIAPEFRDRARERIAQLYASQAVPLVEREFLRLDGTRVSVETSAAPFVYGGRPASQVVVRDITERKRAEAQILKLNAELEERVAQRTRQLEAANKELEAFSYSVSHDLRAPLRGIDGFSQMLLAKHAGQLDETGSDYLQRIRRASLRMGELIDDLLQLSHVSRSRIETGPVDLSRLARSILAELQEREPNRKVSAEVRDGVEVSGDPRLLRIALENLLGNAWKFTAKKEHAKIRFEAREQDGEQVIFVKDNGAGFNMKYAHKLFGAFQRLHGTAEFEGTGIGLATVQRIVNLHGGRVWADALTGKGATFYFVIPNREAA